MRYFLLSLACLSLAACGSDTAPTPPVAQVGGVWSATTTTTGVTGGECFASILQGSIGGITRETFAITQVGATLTATATNDGTGGSCTYQGTAGSSAVTLNLTSCTASDVLGARCPVTNALRDIRLVTGSLSATVTGNNATGTLAQTYNVLGPAGPVGALTIAGSFTATRR